MSEPTRQELEAKLTAMQRQMAELQRQLHEMQSGSGVIVREGGTGAGAGGVAVGGNVHGNIYMGKPTDDPVRALAIYRCVYAAACQNLPLRGVDVGASDAQDNRRHMGLERVYVALDTTAQVPKELDGKQKLKFAPASQRKEMRPLTVLEAVAQNEKMVILGDPGSGKSTFLNYLGLCLTLHALQPNAGWLERLSDWPVAAGDLTPILITLRDFVRTLPERSEAPSPSWLGTFIGERLAAQNLGFAVDAIHALLEDGKVIVLLDGIDEIPSAVERRRVLAAVQTFAARYRKCRFVATCRTLSYQEPSDQLEDWKSYELAAFDQGKIDYFIAAWYDELARLSVTNRDEAMRMTKRLQEVVRRPDLYDLARNPLLLTVMALVHSHTGQLPEARAQLFEETVDLLLLRWDQIRDGVADNAFSLRRLLKHADRTGVDLKMVLWKLAFEVQQAGSTNGDSNNGLADIGELRVLKALAELHPQHSLEWAKSVMEILRLRAGLLIERAPEVYTFPHRTFQEYLAGAHLAAQADFACKAAALVEENLYWRPTILLAASRLVYVGGDTHKPMALVGELCPNTADATALGWRKAWLAGEVLTEIGLNRVQDSNLGRDLISRLRDRLVDLLRTGALRPAERAGAGDVLSRLGDPRFSTELWYLPSESNIGFIEIPEGVFVMGSDRAHDKDAFNDELPQHRHTLDTYYLGRYPVTVAQFREFCRITNYEPLYPASLSDPASRPVRWVTWYEALGYCRWLTDVFRASMPQSYIFDILLGREAQGKRWSITLPSEAEWEKAARGENGQIFSWGSIVSSDDCNYRETRIGTTSVVGCFPMNISPYRMEESSGNVREWTRSLWGTGISDKWVLGMSSTPDYTYPYANSTHRERLNARPNVARVVRGGSFLSSQKGVRCASRDWEYPSVAAENCGFRLAIVCSGAE